MYGLHFFLLSMVVSVLMPLVLFVISWVFSALICMPYTMEASSRWFTNLISYCPCPARLSMSLAKCKFVIVLPLILAIPSWSSSASAIILSKKMLKKVGESRYPWPTPIVVQNHYPMLSWVDCAGRLVVEASYSSDQVVIDVMQPHGYPQSCIPYTVELMV